MKHDENDYDCLCDECVDFLKGVAERAAVTLKARLSDGSENEENPRK